MSSVDPYIDPESGILRNLIGARTPAELELAEADLVSARAVQLVDHPVRLSADLQHLKAIHRHLFQDVYDWAGQARRVDIRKDADASEAFLPVSMIDRASTFAFKELSDDDLLKGLARESSSNAWHITTTR